MDLHSAGFYWKGSFFLDLKVTCKSPKSPEIWWNLLQGNGKEKQSGTAELSRSTVSTKILFWNYTSLLIQEVHEALLLLWDHYYIFEFIQNSCRFWRSSSFTSLDFCSTNTTSYVFIWCLTSSALTVRLGGQVDLQSCSSVLTSLVTLKTPDGRQNGLCRGTKGRLSSFLPLSLSSVPSPPHTWLHVRLPVTSVSL